MSHTSSDVILQRMMALHPKVIDLTLDRVWRLLDRLGNPQESLPPVVHIAGTNGKGSTQAMLRAGFEAAGKTVHAYTSPHLVRFHERIRLAGTLIEEDHLIQVLDTCYEANGSDPITYFEITTCAALLAFAQTPADITLLEVGLGGRLDATNVVSKPAMTVITPVSMDHQQFLGESLPQIAGEKAGILKRGVPAVIGPQEDSALEIIEARAKALGAPVSVYGQHWHVSEERGRLVYQDDSGLLDLPRPVLPGPHQVQNAGAVLTVLRAMGCDDAAFDSAMTKAHWPARLQRLRRGPLVDTAPTAELWLDGGHNPDAGQAIARHLAGLPDRPTFLICGMLNTKDVRGYLRPMAAHAKALVGVSIPGETNTLSADQTAQAARDVGIRALTAASATAALAHILSECPQARVLICGSLYFAGHILSENG